MVNPSYIGGLIVDGDQRILHCATRQETSVQKLGRASLPR
jgi:hypothetical protein